jgi:hypothetical protein
MHMLKTEHYTRILIQAKAETFSQYLLIFVKLYEMKKSIQLDLSYVHKMFEWLTVHLIRTSQLL